MEQYISKSALIAEIERRLKELSQLEKASYEIGLYDAYKIVLSFIDTLEVKEVDLEGEVESYWKQCDLTWCRDAYTVSHIRIMLSDFAKRFFELGARVNNPITAADRGMAEEIIINLKRVEQDYHIDLTKEMEWLRNLMKKGE